MKKRLIIIFAVFVAAIITLFLLVFSGIILLNAPAAKNYSVRGVDVSAYQGDIDWQTLSNQDISFAFVKATEGSSFVDRKFAFNFSEAQKTELKVGVYHFFSYDSSGITQAENFINTVKPFEGMLPPVIDLEFYGDKEKNPPDRDKVATELQAMLDALEQHYGLKPIIYATERSYELYLSGGYEEYDIWIRNVISKPDLADDRSWTFWQYTNRGRLDGYNGEEKYIDINVFCKTKEEFDNYPKYKSE